MIGKFSGNNLVYKWLKTVFKRGIEVM